MNSSDRLVHLFELQWQVDRRIGVVDTNAISDDDRRRWMVQYHRGADQGIVEITGCAPWKCWANYQTCDRQNGRVVIVDRLHFAISLAQVAGVDAFEAYTRKHVVNLKRQGSGCVAKDENAGRHV